MKVQTGWNWKNFVSARLSYKYETANEEFQLQITSEIRARTASDMPLQNVNFHVSFATCVTINFEKVLSCSRKYMRSTGYYKNTNSARCRKKNWELVKFSAVFCLFVCFVFVFFTIYKNTAEDG